MSKCFFAIVGVKSPKYKLYYLITMSIKKINYDQFSENLESILDEVIDDRGVVIVGRADQGDIAVISASELSAMEETLHLLKSPANAQKLFVAMERADKL